MRTIVYRIRWSDGLTYDYTMLQANQWIHCTKDNPFVTGSYSAYVLSITGTFL